jgi:hypothetical protein
MAVVPAELINLLMPWLAPFKASIAAADAAKQAVPTSARSMAELLPYLASAVVQDFLELLTDPNRPASYANNPVHNLLLNGAQKQLVRCGKRALPLSTIVTCGGEMQQSSCREVGCCTLEHYFTTHHCRCFCCCCCCCVLLLLHAVVCCVFCIVHVLMLVAA